MAFWHKNKKEDEPNLADIDASFKKNEAGLLNKKTKVMENSEELAVDEKLLDFNFEWKIENPFDEMVKKFENGEEIHLQNFEEIPYRYSGSEGLASLTFSKEGYYLELSEGAAIFIENIKLDTQIYFSISMTYESFTSHWEAQVMVTEDVNQDNQVSFDDKNVEHPYLSLLKYDFDMPKVKEQFKTIIFKEFLAAYFQVNESKYSTKNLGNFKGIDSFVLLGIPEYFLPDKYPEATYDVSAANPFEEIVQKYGERLALKFDGFQEDYQEETELYLSQKEGDDDFIQVMISPADVIFTLSKAGKTVTFDFDEFGKLYMIDKNFEDKEYIQRCVDKFLEVYFMFNQSEFSMTNLGNMLC
ncbi:hypothetical protein [Lactococcus sp.]|uniref:hypothetical protein n=1 Tax=Lactococcus sp. TaxID=44273 RepID=UPI002FC8E91F